MVLLHQPPQQQVCFQLVQLVDGQAIVSNFGPKVDVLAAMEIRGFTFIRLCDRRGLRAELQGQPEFSNLAGPMWGGSSPEGLPIVRYEDSEAFKRFST